MIKKVIFDCVAKLSEYAEGKYPEYSIHIKRKKDQLVEICLDVMVEGGIHCSRVDIHESELYLVKYPEIVIEESMDSLIAVLEKAIERHMEK